MDKVDVYQSAVNTQAENSHIDMMDDYCERYFEASENYENMYSRLYECIEFLNNIKVPYCYEYAKMGYKDAFEKLKIELDNLGESMCNFPNTIQNVCISAFEDTDHYNKKRYTDYLDSVLSYFHASVEHFSREIEHNAKSGMELYQQSQLVHPKMCR
jgi:hypothetical protein